jgi:hypothetical protein
VQSSGSSVPNVANLRLDATCRLRIANGALRERRLAVSRPSLGYRGAWATLREEFSPLNVKRVHRLWRELRLSQSVKRKEEENGLADARRSTRPNELWCLDFCCDACHNGTKVKVLAMRECLALEAHTSLKAVSVRRILGEDLRGPRRSQIPQVPQRSGVRGTFAHRVAARFRDRKQVHQTGIPVDEREGGELQFQAESRGPERVSLPQSH